LRIGLVGAGGTGSATAEELIRLGIGELVVCDADAFQASNVNRVYGSRAIDDGVPKVKLVERLAADIGVGTRVSLTPRAMTYRSVAEKLKDCDVVFGCTDDYWGRSILTRMAIYYHLPVFDLGVKIDSSEGRIRSIEGRVTTLLPGAPCLYCRRRITAERVRAQTLHETDPDTAAQLVREGYIPELGEPAPAVIPFTTSVAASAVSEFLHRLTGFLGDDRETTEVLHRMHSTEIRRNAKASEPDCFCHERRNWGRGDVNPALDLTWRTE
jgi:molybdopterin/thiamine biosynthesis adenylyltransferase